jgi:putative transposase
MRAPYTQLFVHLIWATWDRLPLITPEIEPSVYAAIATKCRQLKCEPYAIGGINDHIHLLVRLDPNVSVAQLAKEVKGSSSHLVNYEIMPGEFFKWQGGYRAFTIRKNEAAIVKAYIDNQKQHHSEGTLSEDWELDQER